MNIESTIIQKLDSFNNNEIYIKRDDLIPFSFGGNKARKAVLFFEEIDKQLCDCVVTYGSSSSNHCRIISNLCIQRGIPCYIVCPEESSKQTFNSILIESFEAIINTVPVNEVHDTIESIISDLKSKGKNPYFIPGGGHGKIGTQAYVNCYDEIRNWELNANKHFDYIFLASGTGTTQAGLICGQILHKDNRKIVGISIARKEEVGRKIVIDSVREYLDYSTDEIEEDTIFVDEYANKYGDKNENIQKEINNGMKQYGIPLDSTYTGKAFYGMKEYILKNKINNSNILFIHTGGTPLFFNDLVG